MSALTLLLLKGTVCQAQVPEHILGSPFNNSLTAMS